MSHVTLFLPPNSDALGHVSNLRTLRTLIYAHFPLTNLGIKGHFIQHCLPQSLTYNLLAS